MENVIAENYLCFLALLEMVIEDVIGKSYIDQYYLAEYFGITVPYGTDITVNNITFSDKEREFGVHLDENKLNAFFKETGIPIETEYVYINEFEESDYDTVDRSDLRRNSYIVYTYSYGSLYRKSELCNYGHVALLKSVVSERTLEIYDPGPIGKGEKKIDRHALYDAIREINGGLYIFKIKKEHI